MQTSEVPASIGVVEFSSIYRMSCRRCRLQMIEGNYGIGMQVGVRNYLVMQASPTICLRCGQEELLPLVYMLRESASKPFQEMVTALKRDPLSLHSRVRQVTAFPLESLN